MKALLALALGLSVLLAGSETIDATHRPWHKRTPTPIVQVTPTSTLTPVAASGCLVSLQSLIDATPSGGTLVLPPCTWRETIKVSRPITIDGKSVAELRGSDVWTDWAGTGPWISQQVVPSFATRQIDPSFNVPTCADGTHTTCNKPEQLWRDGVWYRRVDGAPRAGQRQFALSSNRRIILADDPRGHTVEVATRVRWLDLSNVVDVTIRGLTFGQSAGSYQDSAVITGGSQRVTLDRISMFEAGYAALSVGSSRDLHILDAEISWNGATGISDYGSRGFQFTKGQVRENNRRGWDYWRGWDAAGIKLYRASNADVSNLLVSGNGAPGIWCDNACQNITFRANTVRDNLYGGIEFEASPGPFVINDNVASGNAYCDIIVWLREYAPTATGSVTNNTGSICRGDVGNEQQPGVTYEGNT